MQNWTDFQIEEKVSALFQPDTLLASEYSESLHRRASSEPEKKLALAILQDAIVTFQQNALAQDERRRLLFREAKDWIFDEQNEWIFSFESICGVLRLNPDYVRGGLLGWSAKMLHPSSNLAAG